MPITVNHTDGIVIVKLEEAVIGPASRQFRDTIAEQLTHVSEVPKFLFDFADVPLIDSTALGVLMGTHQTIMPEQGRIALIHLNPKIETLINRSRLTDVFEQFGSEDEAIKALTSS